MTFFVRSLSPFALDFYSSFYTSLLYLSPYCQPSLLLVPSRSLSRA